jgi:succinate-semialdehyde dehydrogenase/glutarate-semialdehyde dehydrogenase
MREEPFGPIALLVRVADVEEAVTLANAVDYGLTGYAFTRSARDMNVLSERLEVGNLGINQYVASGLETPFGGVKSSGLGRSGGIEGLENFTELKTVLTRFD